MTATDGYSCGEKNVCSCLQVFNVFTHRRHEIVRLVVREPGGGEAGTGGGSHTAGYQESARRERQANNFYFYRRLPGVAAPPQPACGGWHYWLLKGRRRWCCVAVRGSRVPGWPATPRCPLRDKPPPSRKMNGEFLGDIMQSRCQHGPHLWGRRGGEGRRGGCCGGKAVCVWWRPLSGATCPSQAEIKAALPCPHAVTDAASLARSPPRRCDINSSRARVSYKPLDCNDIISSFHG